MTKRCLRKAIGRAKFTYDELLTVVTEIESILNSRPISFVSSLDIEEPLTPFHLLHGRRLSNLPDELCFQQIEEEFTADVSPVLLNKRLRYLHITLDKFWKRWREEYLLNLRERYHYKMQRRSEPRNICVRDVVIIHDDQEVRGFWKLGRVKELIVGTDVRPEEHLYTLCQGIVHRLYVALFKNYILLKLIVKSHPPKVKLLMSPLKIILNRLSNSIPLFLVQSNLDLREQLL